MLFTTMKELLSHAIVRVFYLILYSSLMYGSLTQKEPPSSHKNMLFCIDRGTQMILSCFFDRNNIL